MLTALLAACAAPPRVIPTSASTSQPPATPKAQATPTHSVSATAPPCSVQTPWSVELVVSGGFAGIEHKLEVDSSGAYEAEDLRSGDKVEGSLSPETMARVEQGLSGICEAQVGGRPPDCADCFQYSIEVTMGGVTYQAIHNDMSLPGSSVAPLIGTLTQILNEALGP